MSEAPAQQNSKYELTFEYVSGTIYFKGNHMLKVEPLLRHFLLIRISWTPSEIQNRTFQNEQ